LRKGLSLCRREKIDLIFSSSPPPSVHLSAYLIKRATGIPWVADFRDPWIGYKQEIYPVPVHLFLKKRLERLIVKGADRVIAANRAIKGEFDSRHPGAAKVRLVDQGYDEEDFGAIRSSPPRIFTIGYLGTFSPDCDPRPFLAALGELVEQKTIPPGKIRVVHVGLDLGLNLQRLIRKHKLEDVFEQEGYLSHRESLGQMQETSLLLLITSDQPLVFPAKVFEYLRLKKPILAVVPQESAMARFISEMKVGKVVSPEDREGIKQALLSYFSDFQAGVLGPGVDEDRLRKYERKSLSEKLASIFEEIVSRPC
jgi:glycosyltransferase involved in cell wall biosynthesis